MTNPIVTKSASRFNLEIGRCYRHYKGEVFQILNFGKFEGNDDIEVVIYTSVNTEFDQERLVFARPISEFTGKVTNEKGESVPRFTVIEEKIKSPITRKRKKEKNGLKVDQTFLHYKGGMFKILEFALFEAEGGEQDVVLFVSADFPSNIEFRVLLRPIVDFTSFVSLRGKVVKRFTPCGDHISI